MDLYEAHGKNVKITLLNGYTSAIDNEPDPESIAIDNTELYAPEIKSIELIED